MTKIQDIRNRTKRTNGTRALSAVTTIVRHHSATTGGDFDAFWRHWNGTNGWGTGGYHEIILRDGTVQLCYDPHEITNGVGGQNTYTYHICLVGSGSFTAEQEAAWDDRVAHNMARLNIGVTNVKGHREMPGANTSCPGIDMNTVRARIRSGVKTEPAAKPQTGGTQVEAPKPNPQTKSIAQMADEVIAGRHGSDHDNRRKSLGISASEYAKVRNEVNRRAGASTSKPAPKPVAPSKPKYTLPTGVLRRGAKGNEVRQLQTALNAANFRVGTVDGDYGPKTQDAVRRFQSVHLPREVDGVYGPNTRKALDKAVN